MDSAPPRSLPSIPLEGAAPSAPLRWRKKPAHHQTIDRHNKAVIVFLTVCTQDRKRCLTSQDAALVLKSAWDKARLWQVGRWVLMPDHLHLFCSPTTIPAEPLEKWVPYWKSEAARHWPRPQELPLWQRDFWDTQLRKGDDYTAKWEYVRANPVRAGLTRNADEWPFQGEEHTLMWPE